MAWKSAGGPSTLYDINPQTSTFSSNATQAEYAVKRLVDAGLTYDQAKRAVDSVATQTKQYAGKSATGRVKYTAGDTIVSKADMQLLLAQAQGQANAQAQAEAARTKAKRSEWEQKYDVSREATIGAVDTQTQAAQAELDWAGQFAQSTMDFWADQETEFAPFMEKMKSGLMSELSTREEMVAGIKGALGTGTGDNAAAQAIRDVKARTTAEKGERGRELARLGIDPTSGRYRGAMDRMTSEGIATQAMAANQARGEEKERYLTHAKDYLGQMTGGAYTDAMSAVNNVYLDKAKTEADMMAQVGQAYSGASASFGKAAKNRLGIQQEDAEMLGYYDAGVQATSATPTSGIKGADIIGLSDFRRV